LLRIALPEGTADYGSKEKGYVQPYDDYVNEMIDYIDRYAVDEPSIETRRNMLKDAQVKSVVELLKEAVLSEGWELHYDWEVDKALGTEMVNFLYETFNRINEHPWNAGGVDDMLEKWMDALWFKKMVCELVFEHDTINEFIYVRKAKVLPPESIKLNCDRYGNLLAIQQYPYNIEEVSSKGMGTGLVPPEPVLIDMNKVILWVNGDDYSQFIGKSDLDSVYKYWFLKDFILKFWSMFIERFGAPMLIAFVKAKNMKAARDSLKNILTSSSYSMEQDDKIQMLEPEKEGQAFETMINYCDNEITKGLLVPSLLLGASSEDGSKSLGDIHFKLFEYRIDFIQRKLQNLMRAFIKKQIDLNFNDVKHHPVFTFKPSSLNHRVKMAQSFDLLVKNALVHPLEPWVRAELQLPECDEEFKPKLEQAWQAKMTAGSAVQFPSKSAPATITRTEAQAQQREPSEVGDSGGSQLAEIDNQMQRLKAQFERADVKFGDVIVPLVQNSIEGLIKEVEKKLSKDKNIEMAEEAPNWLNNINFRFGYQTAFVDMYNELLVDIILEDNKLLSQLGMEKAFDVQSRTGAFKWIDQKISNYQQSLINYGDGNAKDLEMRVLADTKQIIQEGIDQGLRGRDIVNNLRETLLGERYSKAQLETVVRTNTTAILNQGKKAFARENAPFVKGMKFVSIIDDRTTDICTELDGKEFAIDDPALDKYTPPLHFNCRSGLDYIIDGTPQFNPEGITQSVPEGFGDDI
jgi:SPP1 gp7 family putative phage head morphogenesis protein